MRVYFNTYYWYHPQKKKNTKQRNRRARFFDRIQRIPSTLRLRLRLHQQVPAQAPPRVLSALSPRHDRLGLMPPPPVRSRWQRVYPFPCYLLLNNIGVDTPLVHYDACILLYLYYLLDLGYFGVFFLLVIGFWFWRLKKNLALYDTLYFSNIHKNCSTKLNTLRTKTKRTRILARHLTIEINTEHHTQQRKKVLQVSHLSQNLLNIMAMAL
jgi:hypothetical protein